MRIEPCPVCGRRPVVEELHERPKGIRRRMCHCPNLCSVIPCVHKEYIGAPTVRAISESFPFFDYIKIGPYIAERGGLDSPTTNQRMYKKQPDGHWEDITSAFQRSYK